MQGMKKTLVALLAVAMVLSLVAPVLAAPADVAGTAYEDAAVRLLALGVFKGDDKGNFNPGAPISRAEAAAVIVRALGLEKSADLMNGATRFPDVNADAGLKWATGAINVAVSSGIVNGYPDGNFGGRDNVTYAQLAKMVLYALNYGVTVEGGVWPTAVLAKADDLDILDGLSVVADAPITRGDASKMLDNSLDVASLRQVGYGDLKTYEADGKSLLEKMGLDEVEGRVVDISATNNRLDEDEVVIEVVKKNGSEQNAKDETYEEVAGVDVQGLFGLKVKAWVKNGKIVFVEKKTAAKDIFVDTAAGAVAGKKLGLVVLDDDVTFDDNAVIYINYKSAKLADIAAGQYGRLVRDKNKIVFASLFDFSVADGVVVSEVSNNKIKYFNTTKTKTTLDLSKADSINVYNKDLTTASYDDIAEDTVLYFWKDGDDHYLVIVNEAVEGKVSKIAGTKVTVGGKKYTFDGTGTWSVDLDDAVTAYTGASAAIKDFDGEEAVALLNLKGDIRHLRGDIKTVSSTQYGLVVDAPKYNQVTIFNQDGDEVTYAVADSGDRSQFAGYEFYAAAKAGEEQYAIVAYKLDSDGDVVKSEPAAGAKLGLKAATEVQWAAAKAAKPVAVPAGNADWYAGYLKKADDSLLVEVYAAAAGGAAAQTFYVSSSTVILRALNSDNDLDPKVVKWEDFKDLKIAQAVKSQAVVFGENGKTAKFVVLVSDDFEGTTEDIYYAVGKSAVYRSGKWKIDLDVYGEGEDAYVVDSAFPKGEGDLFAFKLNSKGEAVVEAVVVGGPFAAPAGFTANGAVDGSYIDVNNGLGAAQWYKVDEDALIYQTKAGKPGKIDKIISLGDLENKTTGTARAIVKTKDNLVKVIVYDPPAAAPAGPAGLEKSELKNAAAAGTVVTVTYDLKKGDAAQIRLVESDGKTIADFVDIAAAGADAVGATATLNAAKAEVHTVEMWVGGVKIGEVLVKTD